MTAERTERFRLRQNDVAWHDVDGEVLGLDLRSLTYFNANASAACIWGLLSRGATRRELVERLAREFELDASQAGHDVDVFLAEVTASGLLEPQPPSGST